MRHDNDSDDSTRLRGPRSQLGPELRARSRMLAKETLCSWPSHPKRFQSGHPALKTCASTRSKCTLKNVHKNFQSNNKARYLLCGKHTFVSPNTDENMRMSVWDVNLYFGLISTLNCGADAPLSFTNQDHPLKLQNKQDERIDIN